MEIIAERRLNLVVLAAAGLLAAAIVIMPVEHVPILLLAAAGVGALAAWAVLGDLLTATLIWFVAVICFDEEFWRVAVPFFFNITISRVLVVVLAVLWVMILVIGRTHVRSPGAVLPLMAALLGFFTLSAAITGFETIAVATVHYRLIGGYWFAFAIFFFVLHGVQTEQQVLRLLKFFFAISVYLTFTAWCEHLELWSLVFPKYITDATKGIHWGRVRGPFLVSPTMGVALVFCYFNNLVLARQVRGLSKLPIYLLCGGILPAVFWTQTRSAWLALILATMVWLVYTRRRWSRLAAICALTAAAIAILTVNMENVSSQDRTRGGVTDPKPIYVRIGLALVTWDMFLEHPLVGVGFGHFRDEAPRYARQVDSPYYQFASSAMEHNNFLSLLAETGVVGLALYLVLLVVLLRISIRLYRRLPVSAPGPVARDVPVLYWVLFVVYIVDGMFRETSVHPFTNSLFFGVSGLVIALDWLLRPQPVRPRAVSGPWPPIGLPERLEEAHPEPGS